MGHGEALSCVVGRWLDRTKDTVGEKAEAEREVSETRTGSPLGFRQKEEGCHSSGDREDTGDHCGEDDFREFVICRSLGTFHRV